MSRTESGNPPFLGKQVRLRPMETKDLEALGKILEQPVLIGRRYLPSGLPELIPLSEAHLNQVHEKWSKAEKSHDLMAERLSDQSVIGYAGCSWWWDTHHPSLHVVIDPAQQQKGYGSEALELLLEYLFFFTPAHNISCWVASWNKLGLAFTAKHGFEKAGTVRRVGMRQGEPYDLVVMNILRPDWQTGEGGKTHAVDR